MKKQIITLAVTGLLLSSCGIYTKYEPVTSIPDQLYGGEVVTEDTASLGNMDWRELFTDPYLQSLIEVGLQTNTDYQSAQLRVEEAQATLMSAKLACLCSCSAGNREQLRYAKGNANLFVACHCQLGVGRLRPYAQCQETVASSLCSK